MSSLSHAELSTITGGTREENPLFVSYVKAYRQIVSRMNLVLGLMLLLIGIDYMLVPLLHPAMLLVLAVYTLFSLVANYRRVRLARRLRPYAIIQVARWLGDIPHAIMGPLRYLFGVGLLLSVVSPTVPLIPSLLVPCALAALLRGFVLYGVSDVVIDNRDNATGLSFHQHKDIDELEAEKRAIMDANPPAPRPTHSPQVQARINHLESQVMEAMSRKIDDARVAGTTGNNAQWVISGIILCVLSAIAAVLLLAYSAPAGFLPATLPDSEEQIAPATLLAAAGSLYLGAMVGHALRFAACPFLLRYPYEETDEINLGDIMSGIINRFATGPLPLVMVALLFYFDTGTPAFRLAAFFLVANAILLATRFFIVRATSNEIKEAGAAVLKAQERISKGVTALGSLKRDGDASPYMGGPHQTG